MRLCAKIWGKLGPRFVGQRSVGISAAGARHLSSSQDTLVEARIAFDAIDKNKDGSISFEEFKAVWGDRVQSTHAGEYIGCPVLLGAKVDPQEGSAAQHAGEVHHVVLTGGPCGGKTSAQKGMEAALRAEGFSVMFVPEVPTVLLSGGCLPALISSVEEAQAGKLESLLAFESDVMRLQLAMEASFRGIAHVSGKPTVIFYDRAVMDIAAYLPGGRDGDAWKGLLQTNGWDERTLMSRYDLVLHLVTAADGAEHAYTCENNTARTETPEQARDLDVKLQACWSEHHDHRIIDNSGDFSDKIGKTVLAAKELLG